MGNKIVSRGKLGLLGLGKRDFDDMDRIQFTNEYIKLLLERERRKLDTIEAVISEHGVNRGWTIERNIILRDIDKYDKLIKQLNDNQNIDLIENHVIIVGGKYLPPINNVSFFSKKLPRHIRLANVLEAERYTKIAEYTEYIKQYELNKHVTEETFERNKRKYLDEIGSLSLPVMLLTELDRVCEGYLNDLRKELGYIGDDENN